MSKSYSEYMNKHHVTKMEDVKGTLMVDIGKEIHYTDGEVTIRASENFDGSLTTLSLQFRDIMIQCNITDSRILEVKHVQDS